MKQCHVAHATLVVPSISRLSRSVLVLNDASSQSSRRVEEMCGRSLLDLTNPRAVKVEATSFKQVDKDLSPFWSFPLTTSV